MMAIESDDWPGLLTRRRLIQASGATAATLYLGALTAGAPAAFGATAAGAPAYLRRSSYARLTNSAFTAAATGGAKATLRLVEVADLARARSEKSFAGRDDAFALTFTGAPGAPLTSAIHELRHASLGTFSVFIAPVGRPTRTEQRYEVVIDRSVTLAAATSAAPR